MGWSQFCRSHCSYSVKLFSPAVSESQEVEIYMGLNAYIMLTLCLLPRVLVIWTELMCSLRTKKEISKLWWAGRLTSCWSHLIKICMKLDTLQHWVVLFVLNCTESYWIPPGSLSALIGNLWETPVCNWFPFNSPRANLDKLFLYTSKSLRLSLSPLPSLSLTHTLYQHYIANLLRPY